MGISYGASTGYGNDKSAASTRYGTSFRKNDQQREHSPEASGLNDRQPYHGSHGAGSLLDGGFSSSNNQGRRQTNPVDFHPQY